MNNLLKNRFNLQKVETGLHLSCFTIDAPHSGCENSSTCTAEKRRKIPRTCVYWGGGGSIFITAHLHFAFRENMQRGGMSKRQPTIRYITHNTITDDDQERAITHGVGVLEDYSRFKVIMHRK